MKSCFFSTESNALLNNSTFISEEDEMYQVGPGVDSGGERLSWWVSD